MDVYVTDEQFGQRLYTCDDAMKGEYVVYKTAFDGGGCGHGPHDVYPDGYHVYAERLADGFCVSFYQSGCFTAMNPSVQPTGTAKRTWVKQ